MASKVSEALRAIRPRWFVYHDVVTKGARVSAKDRSLHGKARIRARRERNKVTGPAGW